MVKDGGKGGECVSVITQDKDGGEGGRGGGHTVSYVITQDKDGGEGGGGGGHTVSYIITQDIDDEAECGHQNPQHQDEQPVQDVW